MGDALLKKTAFFLLMKCVAGAWRNINENCVLPYFFDAVPGDSDILCAGKAEEGAVSGNEYGKDAPVAKVDLVVYDMTELSCVADIDNGLHGKAVCVARHCMYLTFLSFYKVYA